MSGMWEVEELARYLCGVPENDDEADMDDELMDKFDVDLDQFAKISQELLPLVRVEESQLTGESYRGFGAGGLWLLRQRADIEQP